MGYTLSKLIEDEINKIKDEQIKHVCLLLLEYAEIQGGTWKQIIDEKERHLTQRAADLSGTTSKGKGKHHGPQGG